MLWLRLWAGAQLDRAAEQIETLRETLAQPWGVKPKAFERLRGWLAARQGDWPAAQRLLQPLVESDALAELGLAVAAEITGRNSQAIERYTSVSHRLTGTLVGLWARTRGEALTDQPLPPADAAHQLNEYVASLPREIDRMTADPWEFMHLSAEHVHDHLGPLHRFEVRVELENTGPIPLAVGPNSPIASDLLLVPFITTGVTELHTQLEPEVVSLHQRLRLEPEESIEAVIWADRAQSGALFDLTVLRSTVVRWRLVQRFLVDQDNRYLPGPMSVTAETGVARRPPMRPPAQNPQQIQQQLEQATGPELLETIIFMRWLLTSPPGGAPPEVLNALRQESIARILARYDSLSPSQRAFLAYIMPTADQVEQFAPLDEALKADEHRLVKLLMMMRRATSPDHPLIADSLEADDPVVREAASILQRRLAARDQLEPDPLEGSPRRDQPSTSPPGSGD